MTDVRVRDIAVATVKAGLPAPVVFGAWIMNYREYAIVRVTLSNGVTGWSFTLTRDGAIAEQVRRSIAPVYVGTSLDDRQETYRVAMGRSPASHSSGIGLRALSIVDLAVWDAASRTADLSISEFLGGRSEPMPVTAIVGYPPANTGPVEVMEQVQALSDKGWRRFKLPVASSNDLTAARLRAARRAAPDAWIGCDGAWTFATVGEALELLNDVADVNLGWFEDVFRPGDVTPVADLRRRTTTPIAMGDEQGGSYYPQALLDSDAVDVVRVDLTCMGGISGGLGIIEECSARSVEVSPHMFAHVHSQVFSAWGHFDAAIEWGLPWTGVDPVSDSLTQPTVRPDGRMEPLSPSPGFGPLINFEWLASQDCDDPNGILGG